MTWKTKPCGCVKAKLPISGKVMIRCRKHRGKSIKSGRKLCYLEDGMVRAEETQD